jgi:uncharacterized protein
MEQGLIKTDTMFTNLKGKPEIVYPCRWIYKLFGTDQDKMRDAVAETLGKTEYTLVLSRSSRHRKYHCMNLSVLVKSEDNRTQIYEALMTHKDFVLIL